MNQMSLIVAAALLAAGYCPWGEHPLVVSSPGPYDISGSSADKYDVVFVAEGFSNSSEDIERFDEKVEFAIQTIVNTTPFRRCAFNFYTVRLESNESGADFPLADSVICKDTALNFQYGDTDLLEVGIDEWILYTPTVEMCIQAAEKATDDYELVVVLVNETTYGGMSDRTKPVVATCCGTAMDSILVHELGHQFGKTHEIGGLEDEYPGKDECYNGDEPEGPNATKETDRNLVKKWADLIEETTPVPTSDAVFADYSESQLNAIVGLWEGAFDYDRCVYRAQRICMMNQVGDPFCAVCSRALAEVTQTYCSSSTSSITVTMSWTCSWTVTCHLNAIYEIRLPVAQLDAPPGGWSGPASYWNSQTDSLRIDLGPLPGVENVKLVDRSGQLIAEGAVGAAYTASVEFALATVWGDAATAHAPYYLTYRPRYCPSVHSFSATVYLNDHQIDDLCN